MPRNVITFSISLLPEQREWLELQAVLEDRSASAVIRRLIDTERRRQAAEAKEDSPEEK